MNHEQPKHRKHRSEREPLIGDHFINHLIDTAPDAVAAARITEAYGYHGTAIAAFLGLDDTDPYNADIALDFLNCDHGHYRSMDELIDEVVESHGWNQALDQVFADHPGLELVVVINRDAVTDLMDMRFDIVDLGDLYVFEK